MFNINPIFGTLGYKQGVFQIPSLVLVYGLRKLMPNYSGYCIRVVRSSDSAEQDIGFVGNDLDTTSLASFIGVNSGTIKTWYDQSGHGYNATQGSTGLQPHIVISGSLVTTNSLPAIKFGNSSYTNLVTSNYGTHLAGTYKQESYGFLMDFTDSGSSTNIIFENNGGGQLDNPAIESKASGLFYRYDGGGTLRSAASGAYTLSPSLRFQTIDETNLEMKAYRDASLITTTAYAAGFNNKSATSLCIGGRTFGGYLYNTTYYTGKLTEFYVFAKTLTEGEITVIKNNSYLYYSI